MKGTYKKVQHTIETYYNSCKEEIPQKQVLAIFHDANPATVIRAYNMAIGDLRRINLMKQVMYDRNWTRFKKEVATLMII